ncbi:porin family protein [Hyunsoonleella pacifica]|uniref:tRNA modification GTPase n=1 Tax=Hyunsoonleella pacifica TaxID=1080224 RepID=A0A4Q9FJM4_9FLAO|nr:tRNA modification GTPase [Hyunsoonleella pacifica]TBN13168.1 tRNA modification GTPase [Hyunsoonleella pacifica]GGD28738.1 hypothetical protein GCM10011368_33410 [Hyunsoonleella pacifica]
MLKNILTIIVFGLFIIINSHSQITYEKGYYINNLDDKVECLIKNLDWINNPSKFTYKISENEEEIEIGVDLVKEFGIYDVCKYVKTQVNIDRSDDKKNNLSYTKKPSFSKETLLLKVLLDGKASLYLYRKSNIEKFFFSIENDEIKQLVYKQYFTSQREIGTNNQFKQQIRNALKCSEISISTIKNLNYNTKSLLNVFKKFNNCTHSEYIDFNEKKQSKDNFNLSIRPRINSSKLVNFEDLIPDFEEHNFEKNQNLGVGIEFEYILGFNSNKWALFIEPTYRFSSYEGRIIVNPFDLIIGQEILINLDYSSIEIPLGLRHYFFFNEKSKLFLNAAVVFDVDLNSKAFINNTKAEVNSSPNLALGLGYKFKDKYSLELRYNTPRRLSFPNEIDVLLDHKTVSLILGYSIF